ncbi:LysR family transcriptional regulator substrate-binding protein [Bacillus sp. P1(2020)]|uniref:LysR family transcriptional regulator substrate-binding protein n=2 Tax=Pallidibacillus pasinlerensis TaxID=2703818 RepID=A0ABX0A398_9BACI|nr:LysR family transcriptional regulator substrate-binding protein [Pallidibacillus pasinlerensis]
MNPLLSPVILKYKEIYPNINLSVQGLRTEEIRKALLENELDFGVVFLPVEDEELESIPLLSEELSLVVPVKHYLATYETIDWKQLEDVPLILQPEDYFLRKQIDEFAEELDVKLKPTLELTAIESMIELVSQGVGGAILPENKGHVHFFPI